MKLVDCPLNGRRNISEFACLGEVKPVPQADADPAVWAEHVFLEHNTAGIVREWWIHIATNFVFIIERDTRTDEILGTYRIGDPRLAGRRADGAG